MPLKLKPPVVETSGPVVVCKLPGVCGEAPPGPEGSRRKGRSPWIVGNSGLLEGRSRMGGETSCLTAAITSTGPAPDPAPLNGAAWAVSVLPTINTRRNTAETTFLCDIWPPWPEPTKRAGREIELIYSARIGLIIMTCWHKCQQASKLRLGLP